MLEARWERADAAAAVRRCAQPATAAPRVLLLLLCDVCAGAPEPANASVIVGFIAYMCVGMWNNYSQYGAAGWDLLPHRDFWREFPYLVKDAAQHVFRSVSRSTSSSAGYEPV